jgi:hypothetical protein
MNTPANSPPGIHRALSLARNTGELEISLLSLLALDARSEEVLVRVATIQTRDAFTLLIHFSLIETDWSRVHGCKYVYQAHQN